MNAPSTAVSRLHPGLRLLFHAPVHLYRWRLGWLLGRRFLLLSHIGRHSGMRRETVLEVLAYRQDGPEAIVMSAFGSNAAWLRNIEANPIAEVTIGSQRFPAVHRFLKTDDAVEVLKGYLQRNRLIAPVVRFVLSRLVDFTFDGSHEQCRRLVEQLPLIGFRARS
jgi:deazaflavin-dependent oxidoreductase (nitroreductase family)